MPTAYRIKEFESFTRRVNLSAAGFHALPEKVFDTLERFILENKPQDDTQAWEFLSLSVKHGIKVISAKNYVGIITMNDGTTIEILPKLDKADEAETIRVFRDMLCTVKDLPYKSFKESSVMSDRMTLFEVYIRMFLDEVGILVKRGLKSGYVYRERNEPFLKGRLDFNRHIKTNLTHKERFFVGYDEFEVNRPENRLIKSTLRYVKQKTHDPKNLRDSKRYLMIFTDIDESDNYEKDFASYTVSRNMMEYDTVLKWCRIFLMNKSFTAFRGSEVAFALLFPMEQLFESYVADRIQRHMDARKYHVKAQDKRYHLFDSPRKFSLRPDIVVANYETKANVVLDTKWKMLSPQYHNYGISQADMYQMYVYHKKYRPEKVILLYPFNQSFKDSSKVMGYRSEETESVQVCAAFFDLLDVDGSLARIERLMEI